MITVELAGEPASCAHCHASNRDSGEGATIIHQIRALDEWQQSTTLKLCTPCATILRRLLPGTRRRRKGGR